MAHCSSVFLENRRLSLIGLIEGSFCLRCCNGETPHDPLAHRFAKEDGALPVDRATPARARGWQDSVGGRARRRQDRIADKPRGWQDHAESFGTVGRSSLGNGLACAYAIIVCRISAAASRPRGDQKGVPTVKSLLAYLRTPPKGYATWHVRVSAWWRAKPGRAKALDRTCKVLKYACYLLYPALLVMLAWEWVRNGCVGMPRDCLQALAVPAVGFALVSLMRRAINEPRPYEACGIEKLIDKDTQGKSFPSRHSFSIAVIGMCWLRYVPAAGVLILLASLVMAWARVLAGVHYPRDVAYGLALGVLAGLTMWV